MRIIAGSLGGRTFDSPKNQRTHPMAERVRAGLFNSLGDIEGLSVLDPFAGSGALALEAISRGASEVVAIEIDKKASDTLAKNRQKLDIDPGRLKSIRANVNSWSDQNPHQLFQLLLIDPPYDKIDTSLINKLTNHLKQGGLLVLSWPGGQSLPDLQALELVRSKSYGDAQLGFYRLSI